MSKQGLIRYGGPAMMLGLSVPYLAGVGLQLSRGNSLLIAAGLSVPYLAGVGLQPHEEPKKLTKTEAFSSLSSGSGSATWICL